MTRKELNSYIDTKKELEQLNEMLETAYARATDSSAGSYDKIGGGSPEGDKISRDVAKIVEIKMMYSEEIENLSVKLLRIEKAIQKLSNPRERQLIRLRYIAGKKWDEIYDEMFLSQSQVHRMHRSAIKKIIGNTKRQ